VGSPRLDHWLPVAVGDVAASDPRLRAVGRAPSVWADDGSLTIAVRRTGGAPYLVGTVEQPMRAAGTDLWALRLGIPDIQRACIEYAIYDPGEPSALRLEEWRGPRGGRPAPRQPVPVSDPEVIDDSPVAERHPVRAWTPAVEPRALLVCADGEGLADWASVVAATDEPVALVGVESAGLAYQVGQDAGAYEAALDPRARAYLRDIDPAYFAEHMRYVLERVVPWAEARFGLLPRIAFGVSNGAAWAVEAAAAHRGEFSGVLAFSLGLLPVSKVDPAAPPHALVAGRLEPGFDDTTTRYARRLRRHGVPVRLRRPVRGHDHGMWADELIPALRWVRATYGA
jgi:S-formylglutathione hydrolase FrmB